MNRGFFLFSNIVFNYSFASGNNSFIKTFYPMKVLTFLSLPSILLSVSLACDGSKNNTQTEATSAEITSTETTEKEKPVQHLIVPDVGSWENAIEVMDSTTARLKTKETLDAVELNEIHMITYSLEKAVAYFSEHTTGEQQKSADEIALVVEEVHLNSENKRAEETREALDRYFKLAEAFRNDM